MNVSPERVPRSEKGWCSLTAGSEVCGTLLELSTAQKMRDKLGQFKRAESLRNCEYTLPRTHRSICVSD